MSDNEFDLSNTVDAETEVLYKKYEHLQRIDSHSLVSVRVRRVFAWIVDWFFVCLSAIIAVFVTVILEELLSVTLRSIIGLLLFLIVILSFCGFAFRDILFVGRTPGKRLMGLVVIDGKTGETPRKGRLALRGLFLFLYPVDSFVLLATGRSIGDRVSRTYVVRNKVEMLYDDISAEELDIEVNSYTPPKKKSAKKVIIVMIVFFVLSFIIALSVGNWVLNRARETEEYHMAFEYLIDSGALDDVNATADDVSLVGFEGTLGDGVGDKEYTFRFKGHHATVVCHRIDSEWLVCGECTGFGEGMTYEEIGK